MQPCPFKRVLVAEDEADILDMLCAVLESEGAQVATAHDGGEALALLRSGFQPDAVVTDLMMPGTTGVDLAIELRAQPETIDLPIVAISASPYMLQLVDDDVDARLEKPFSLTDLLDTLEKLCVSPRKKHSPRASPRASC